jgi:hypothetical protein
MVTISIIFILIGVPNQILAFIVGMLTNSFTGSFILTLSTVIVCTIAFKIGQHAKLKPNLGSFISTIFFRFSKTNPFNDTVDNKPAFDILATSIQKSSSPLSWTCAYCGLQMYKAPILSILSAIFISALPISIVYGFAGDSVGCALNDYTLGLKTSSYTIPALASTFLVAFYEFYSKRNYSK